MTGKLYKGIILVGGPSTGTRFRPLSMDIPKPLFPIAGSPMIYHHVNALAKVQGMAEILLIGFYEQREFDRFLMEMQIEFPEIQFRYLREYQAMGTAGGMHLFRDEISRGDPDAFFVMNGDTASSFPLMNMINTFNQTGGIATVLAVRKPKNKVYQYGCMVVNSNTKLVDHFVEKPESFISDVISCGVYLFSRDIFKYYSEVVEKKHITAEVSRPRARSNAIVPSAEPVHMERDIFPLLVQKKVLYAEIMDDRDFWMAVKTGSSTILANRMYLQYFYMANPRRLSSSAIMTPGIARSPSGFGPEIIQPAFIHPTAIIDPTAKIGPNVFIGPRVILSRGVRVKDAIILDGVEVRNDSCIIHAVVGWDSKIGSWSRVEGSGHSQEESTGQDSATQSGLKIPSAAILGKAVLVADEVAIIDCIVLPHKDLKDSFQQEIVM